MKTQAVCLWGLDLPRLLPDTAALPRLQLLPSLVEDVEAALGHAERQLAQHATAGSRGSASEEQLSAYVASTARAAAARQQAAAIIAATAAGLGSSGTSSSSGGGGELAPQPVLLKGAAAHWPAAQRWTLGHLAAAGLEGRARVAPSLQFPFTEPRLASLLAEQQGLAALPSCLARMDATEFAARMQRGNPCDLPPLVYGSAAEYLYFQAQLPPELLQEVDLTAPPFMLPAAGSSSSSSGGSGAGLADQRLRQTQAARVWVGPQGAVSPTHYDTSHSFLTQIRGRKRMLFWSPDQLPSLYCYPDTHLLRRRSRVNMHAPLDASKFPLFARAAAAEALLEPGDVVFFPSRWAHYTESLDCSISVTCRFEGAA
ncbi:lysine-specific demethylase 8 [Chlorella sorokiniana]|uniref:Lysine-specific demethylase 8 n=1 Tax=Chlorella sorokiniana TaxID=3076 RepID=A0A2P6TQL4_CHLSO|nr:lysine-specific demethylase 8 [Chlorella sorokiniana]|eukprot:PRW56320.1 lysine-specific demethylase 8 [Chlorella sorokiniana]